MSDWKAPERVWIGPGIHWQEPPEGTEYVRADRLAAVERERDEARELAEARGVQFDREVSKREARILALTGQAKVLRARVEELEGTYIASEVTALSQRVVELRERVEELEAGVRIAQALLTQARAEDSIAFLNQLEGVLAALLIGGSREEPRPDQQRREDP